MILPDEFTRRMLEIEATVSDPMDLRERALTLMVETLITNGFGVGIEIFSRACDARRLHQ